MATPAPLAEIRLTNSARTIDHWVRDWDDEDPFILDAPYQRGSVWDTERRRNLIRSLLLGLPCGSIVVANIGYSDAKCFRVVDGKQRVEALRAFFRDEFTVPGWWFATEWLSDESARDREVVASDLSRSGNRRLRNRTLGELEFNSAVEWAAEKPAGADRWPTRDRTPEQMLQAEAEVYLLVNFGGVDQTDEDRDRATAIANP